MMLYKQFAENRRCCAKMSIGNPKVRMFTFYGRQKYSTASHASSAWLCQTSLNTAQTSGPSLKGAYPLPKEINPIYQ